MKCAQTFFGTRVLNFGSLHQKPLILNFVMNKEKVTCFVTDANNLAKICREGMLKQTSVYNISLRLHAKSKRCLLKFDAMCTVSAFSFVSSVLRKMAVFSCLERCLYCERLLSTRVSKGECSCQQTLELIGMGTSSSKQ